MQNIKLFLATIFLSFGLVLGMAYFLSKTSSTGPAAEKVTSPQQIVSGARHFTGALDDQKPPFVIVEFSDLQCPACAAYHPRVKALVQQHPETVQVVFRHYPLQTIHANAMAAAKAAEAAAGQGKFWEFADELYLNQSAWERLGNPQEYFVGVAQKLGLKTDEFTKAMSESSTQDAILGDIRLGEQLRINSTPTFYLNGQLMGWDQIEQTVNAAK